MSIFRLPRIYVKFRASSHVTLMVLLNVFLFSGSFPSSVHGELYLVAEVVIYLRLDFAGRWAGEVAMKREGGRTIDDVYLGAQRCGCVNKMKQVVFFFLFSPSLLCKQQTRQNMVSRFSKLAYQKKKGRSQVFSIFLIVFA